jgi:ketoreductase RED1
MEAAWKKQAPVSLDAAAQTRIIEQANASFARTPVEQLERSRDAKQLAILRALAPLSK